MAQRISHIYRLVTFPAVYSAIGSVLGAHAARVRFVAEDLQPVPGSRILDVGCGPGAMLPYLPDADYTGVDLNPLHIEAARRNYGARGRFLSIDASADLPGEPGSYDLVFALAILHHLDDGQARPLLANMLRLVREGGRVVTFDSVRLPRQNPIARLFNALDSGLNIRTAQGYAELAEGLDAEIETRIYRDRLRVPFDHFRMTLTRRPEPRMSAER